MILFWKHSHFMNRLITGFAFCILSSASSSASVVFSAGSVTVPAGSSMDSLDVYLTNFGSSALAIGGFSFSFSLSVANANITFTDVNTSTTVAYIFSGNSLFGPDLSGPNSGQTVTASDVVFTPFTGTTVSPGGTVGLGHVVFNVSANATAGAFAVSLAPFPRTTLSDAQGNNVNVDALSPGEITITTVPEPSSFFMLLSLTATLFRCRLRSSGGTQEKRGTGIFRS